MLGPHEIEPAISNWEQWRDKARDIWKNCEYIKNTFRT